MRPELSHRNPLTIGPFGGAEVGDGRLYHRKRLTITAAIFGMGGRRGVNVKGAMIFVCPPAPTGARPEWMRPRIPLSFSAKH